MRNPDEIDLEIIRLLVTNGRRPFSEIAEKVNLSSPAVSDRVERLSDLGIIRNFTVDVDRTKLQNRTPILLQIRPNPIAVESVYERVISLTETEHQFQLFNGEIVAHVNVPTRDVHAWLRDTLSMQDIDSYEIHPVSRYDWQNGINPSDFTISCAVCDNLVKGDGETARIGGEIKAFCCPSCKEKYQQRFESLQKEIER